MAVNIPNTSDFDLARERHKRANERAERARRVQEDEESIIRDLASVGVSVQSIWDFVNTTDAYPNAIPVLIQHVTEEHEAITKEGLARALTVKEARPTASRALISEFEPARHPWHVQAALATAIGYVADASLAADVARLIQDRRLGIVRWVLIDGIRRIRDARIVGALVSVLEDEPGVGRMAAKELGMMRAPEALAPLRRAAERPDSALRETALKAIERIETFVAAKRAKTGRKHGRERSSS